MEWNERVIHSFREFFNGMAKSLQAIGTDNLEIANGLGNHACCGFKTIERI